MLNGLLLLDVPSWCIGVRAGKRHFRKRQVVDRLGVRLEVVFWVCGWRYLAFGLGKHQHVLELVVGVQEVVGLVFNGDFPAQSQFLNGSPEIRIHRHVLEIALGRTDQAAQKHVVRQVVRDEMHRLPQLLVVFLDHGGNAQGLFDEAVVQAGHRHVGVLVLQRQRDERLLELLEML